MALIVPTITAFNAAEYKTQMEMAAGLAERVHIDLMDGVFASTKSPGLDEIWWPHVTVADIHLMYQKPMDHLKQLIKLRPHLVVVHNEAEMHHMHFAGELHKEDIKVGLAILHDTPIEWAQQIMHSFDHILIFSGKLGHHGGEADLALLEKVKYVRREHPNAEISWDGGINDQNARTLIDSGVDVLNAGGFIQKARDPRKAYDTLQAYTQ